MFLVLYWCSFSLTLLVFALLIFCDHYCKKVAVSVDEQCDALRLFWTFVMKRRVRGLVHWKCITSRGLTFERGLTIQTIRSAQAMIGQIQNHAKPCTPNGMVKRSTDLQEPINRIVDPLDNSQAYIPKRRTLIQVLPPANAHTKSANAYIHFVKSFCCLLMHYAFFLRIAISHSMRTLFRQNAYMHEQVTKEFA